MVVEHEFLPDVTFTAHCCTKACSSRVSLHIVVPRHAPREFHCTLLYHGMLLESFTAHCCTKACSSRVSLHIVVPRHAPREFHCTLLYQGMFLENHWNRATTARLRLMSTIKNSCLPKLICELNASPYREKLSESEKSLLSLIRDTSISVTAEVTSKYHFAAHMGQLIAGVDGAGCHNFYPSCPFPNMQVLNMMKKVRLR
uniref:Uncharacterized protein n=1 Tax=Timema cristinae TaxID=61476 RepID=A0A7R9CZG4_TIMCR|nr:unnamed protein product [Timema cristinae]